MQGESAVLKKNTEFRFRYITIWIRHDFVDCAVRLTIQRAGVLLACLLTERAWSQGETLSHHNLPVTSSDTRNYTAVALKMFSLSGSPAPTFMYVFGFRQTT